ncbi:MAG TPA: hypothetical protein VES97_10510 [Solirubrobacteraceae bacterium]|nr:hypothetical protein [Solirubrobacteraceae bacterium]
MTIDRFTWTIHAEERLSQRGLTRARVERAVRELHPIRETNEGEAEWRIDAGNFVVVYDHPDSNDIDAVRIVSAWTKRRRRKRRSSGSYPG